MEKDKYKARVKSVIRNICISTVILFLGIIFIVKSFSIEKEVKNFLYSYNLFQSVNYTVDLKDNEYFKNNTLGMNMSYISELVDKVNLDFSYKFNGTKDGKIKYNYQIVAYTKVNSTSITEDENNKLIWQNTEVLLEPKTIELEKSSSYDINEKVQIDFASYNEKIQNLSKTYRIPVEASLEVKLIVKTDADIENVEQVINEYSVMNVKMDLNETVFSVNKDFKQNDQKTISDVKPASKKINKVQFIIGVIEVVIALLIMLDSIRKSIKFSAKSDYAIALNRILKNYGDVVAEIVSPIEVDNLNVIEVKNFDQLLDIEITTFPNKVKYNEGEKFQTDGMIVIAKYASGKSEQITNYEIDKKEELSLDDKNITISYQEKTAIVPITVIRKNETLGDINNDGKINATDAKLALKYYAGKTILDDDQKIRADVNKDEKINATDAKLILKYYTGKINEF